MAIRLGETTLTTARTASRRGTIRLAVYTTAVLPAVVVDTDVIAAGVESGAIPDAAITASSTYGPQCAPPTARLAYNAKKDDLRIFVYDCDEAA